MSGGGPHGRGPGGPRRARGAKAALRRRRYRATPGAARIVALTSDHTVNKLPYGASKGALDRIVVAAARELAHLKITPNVINPGPVDTGWFRHELTETVLKASQPAGTGRDPRGHRGAGLVLFSDEGAWVNGQLLHCDGGLHA